MASVRSSSKGILSAKASRRSVDSISPDGERACQSSTLSATTPTEADGPSSLGQAQRASSSLAEYSLPNMQHVDDLEEWITAERTWTSLKRMMLKSNDLMSYRSIIHRIVRRADIVPSPVLRSLANYAWQYRGYASQHALKTKETGAAVIAIVQTAALGHLPVTEEGMERSHCQSDSVESIHEVLDALQDGFPCPFTIKQAERLSKLIDDDAAWYPSHSLSTMAALLGGYIETALMGHHGLNEARGRVC